MNQHLEVPEDLASRLGALRAWSEALTVRLLDLRLHVQRQLIAGDAADLVAIDHTLALCERLDEVIKRAREVTP